MLLEHQDRCWVCLGSWMCTITLVTRTRFHLSLGQWAGPRQRNLSSEPIKFFGISHNTKFSIRLGWKSLRKLTFRSGLGRSGVVFSHRPSSICVVFFGPAGHKRTTTSHFTLHLPPAGRGDKRTSVSRREEWWNDNLGR